MNHLRNAVALALTCATLASCDAQPEPAATGLTLKVAALTLQAVKNACYDVRVATATDTVWAKGDPLNTRGGRSQLNRVNPGVADNDTLCSDSFGNASGGDITYIGPCDASPEADTQGGTSGTQNDVTIRVDGLYDDAGVDVGEWQDPCAAGCTLSFTCAENEDTLVEFNLTILRDANQGFFDIAINFEDVFCSAKLDTCYDGDRHIELLHGADGARDWTGVFGFACSAGTNAVATNLLYGQVTIDCGTAGVFAIDPTADAGNASVTVGDDTLHHGIYRGLEDLDCDAGPGSCKKVYWNLAFSIDDLLAMNATCTLSLSATVNDDNQGFSQGVPTASGLIYPYIDVLATLTTAVDSPATSGIATCQQHPLNGASGVVKTAYKGTTSGVAAPPVMCFQYDGAASATGASVGCDATPAGAWTAISASAATTLALRDNGTLWAWGDNTLGQFGNGTTTGSPSAVQVGDKTDWDVVSVGGAHVAALTKSKALWTWGSNGVGQIGNGSLVDSSVPVQVGLGTEWQAVSAGWDHTVALKSDGTLWAWGNNDHGQLGVGLLGPSSAAEAMPVAGNDWASVSAGRSFTAALKSDGTIWMWGDNALGQLGNGSTGSSAEPMQVGTDSDWTSVSAANGGRHVVAQKLDGTLWAWGNNDKGQLGTGAVAYSATPIPTGVGSQWSSASAGTDFTSAINVDGTLWAWGNNDSGQLGDGTNVLSSAPVRVGSASDWWLAASAGGAHSAGLKVDGAIWTWGANQNGQLGNGTTVSSLAPLQPNRFDGRDNPWAVRFLHRTPAVETEFVEGSGYDNNGFVDINPHTYPACLTGTGVLITGKQFVNTLCRANVVEPGHGARRFPCSAIRIESCTNVTITENDFDGVMGAIYATNSTDIKVSYNRYRNVGSTCVDSITEWAPSTTYAPGDVVLSHRNRYQTLLGGTSSATATEPGPGAKTVVDGTVTDWKEFGANCHNDFVQFVDTWGGYISHNKGLGGQTEDIVSIYKSGGQDAANPLKIEFNAFEGIIEPNASGGIPWISRSGSGMMLGDQGMGTHTGSHIVAANNRLLNVGQAGIGVAGGIDIRVMFNTVYSELNDNANVGIFVYNQTFVRARARDGTLIMPEVREYEPCNNIEVRGNRIFWFARQAKPPNDVIVVWTFFDVWNTYWYVASNNDVYNPSYATEPGVQTNCGPVGGPDGVTGGQTYCYPIGGDPSSCGSAIDPATLRVSL